MFYDPQYPMKYECFDSLSLTLPPEATQVHTPQLTICQVLISLNGEKIVCSLVLPMLFQVTLHDCLLEFTKPEIVHDVDCPQCSKVS